MKLLTYMPGTSERLRITVEVVKKHWFKKPSKVIKTYEGSGTVWYEYPTGIKQNSEVESVICNCIKQYEMSIAKKI